MTLLGQWQTHVRGDLHLPNVRSKHIDDSYYRQYISLLILSNQTESEELRVNSYYPDHNIQGLVGCKPINANAEDPALYSLPM